jgi:uncharacterized membrane protein
VFSWETLEPVNGVLVTINTTPVQQKVTENGSYFFESIPPGHYKLKAYFKQEGIELYAEENVTITQEGKYVMDLILFPILFEDDTGIEEIDFSIPDNQHNDYGWIFWISGIAVSVGAGLIYLIFRKRGEIKDKTVETFERDKISLQPEQHAIPLDSLPEDLREITDILIREGGRISQKDLRRRLGYSEAKISLMIADLERRGIVEKVKKGRGNIIFLRDEIIDAGKREERQGFQKG